MFCSKCGTENDGNSKFCVVCGNTLAQEQRQSNQQQPNQLQYQQQSNQQQPWQQPYQAQPFQQNPMQGAPTPSFGMIKAPGYANVGAAMGIIGVIIAFGSIPCMIFEGLYVKVAAVAFIFSLVGLILGTMASNHVKEEFNKLGRTDSAAAFEYNRIRYPGMLGKVGGVMGVVTVILGVIIRTGLMSI